MTIDGAYKELWIPLQTVYEVREARNIAALVVEHLTGLSKTDRIFRKEQAITDQQHLQLEQYLEELLRGKPVQYVLQEAWFGGLKFYVNESVLIPRPETEELVEWMVSNLVSNQETISIQTALDIGTGSGCIAIALKSKLPELKVSALDVSEKALEVAKKNARDLHADIDFLRIDALDENSWNQLPLYDYIISNPPYIKKSEAPDMRSNVVAFEPETALFVQDEDPLLFYRKITCLAKDHLTNEGKIFFEVNEAHAEEVAELFSETGFTEIEIKNDMQGKPRMVKAEKPGSRKTAT